MMDTDLNNSIEVAVIELTNKCDLNCIFCPSKRKNDFIDVRLLKRFLKENSKLGNPIKTFELGWGGNPILHKDIKSILGMFWEYRYNANIVTNGLNLKKILSRVNSEFLELIYFTIFLCSTNQKKNDFLMGKKVFEKTIESLNYLKNINRQFDILMYLTPYNYGDIKSMVNFISDFGGNLLIPIENFPSQNEKTKSFLLTDKQKNEVSLEIDELRNNEFPVHKVIHFEYPSANCTYLRYKRLFINSRSNLSFCHFLAHLSKSEITDCRKYSFVKLLQINNIVRSNFVKNKEQRMENWKYPRQTASPCSYCIQQFGVKCKW